MKNNFSYVVSVAKKEFKEIKNSLLKLLFVFSLPLASIGLIGLQEGNGGALSPELNVLATLIFAGVFSAILLKDSITREKQQHTLEILLASKVNIKYIIVGKIVSVLIIAMFFQFIEIGLLYVILAFKGSSLLAVFTIQSIVLMPFIYYIMSVIILAISIIINDDKVSDMIGIIASMFIGASLLYLANFLGALISWPIFLVFFIGLIVLAIVLTFFCEWILVKSLLFIKI